jgi:hypothetical protein
MTAQKKNIASVAEAAEGAVADLVRVSHWGEASYVNLPLIYPDGSSATVKICTVRNGFRVSDNGFAFRNMERIGAQRSFARTAASAAERSELFVDKRCIYVDASADFLSAAICEVAMASWQATDRVFQRAGEEEGEELEEYLRERLAAIFPTQMAKTPTVQGASTHSWDFSAVVNAPAGISVFQAVGNHMASVNRASTSFLDLSNLTNPPHLIAVVKDKAAMEEKLLLLSQAGSRVIEEAQPDEVYRRAAT